MVSLTLSKLDGTWPSATCPGFEADLAGSRGQAWSLLLRGEEDERPRPRSSWFLRGERPQLTRGSEGQGTNQSRCRAAPRASLSRQSIGEELRLKKTHNIVSKRPLPALVAPVEEPAPPDLLWPLAGAALAPVAKGSSRPRPRWLSHPPGTKRWRGGTGAALGSLPTSQL